jgi:hypothetical protein
LSEAIFIGAVIYQSKADGGNHFARFLDMEAEVSEIDGTGYDK